VDTPLRFGAITAGAQHTCAIARDALAYCWGSNQFGQLGVPSPRTASGPVAVMGDRRWQSIAAGADHTCGVTVDGAAFCWGSNDAGQLGVAGGMRSAPVAVRNPGPFTSVSAGWDRSCATTASGAAFCWGLVWAYAAGGVDYANLVSVPARVPGEGALQGVSAGTLTNCGTRDDDTAVCWGANLFAQRGDGTLAGSTQPLAVRSDVRFRAVSAGSIQSCGIALDRRAHCWGNNSFGQIGTRTLDDCAGIVCARVPAGVAPSLRFVELRTGLGNHVCGITTMTNLYCWGLGTNGQLGVGAREAVIRREPELVQRAR